MPLPKEIVGMLVRGDLKTSTQGSPYLDKLPALGPDIFPDNLRIWDLSTSGGDDGRKLHRLLTEAGLSKSQRAGVTLFLGSFVRVEDGDLTLGDIRALTEEELIRLRGHYFGNARPAIDSIKKIKKLFG